MTQRTSYTTVICLLCSLSLPAWGQQYFMYEPKQVKAEEKDKVKDGILVTEVTVKKGDTLKQISKSYSGRASYFPQILLFNKIKNPDRIYPGEIFKVPVTIGGVETATESADKSGGKSRKHFKRKKGAARYGSRYGNHEVSPAVQGSVGYGINNGDAAPGAVRLAPPSAVDPLAGQKLFERAIKAYKQEDYGTALELFDRYLAENPNSPLAADASLYKAECYLKLSAK